jgi:hypothetical protein
VQDYWLAHWLDEREIRNEEEARKALDSRGEATRVLELAAEASQLTPQPQGTRGVVAGSQIDLSGRLSCNHPECLREEVDSLFRRTWHYFDSIVVEGLGPYRFVRSSPREADSHWLREMLLLHVDLLLHLRRIGAEPYLIFQEKPHAFCDNHYRKHAEELGLPATLDDNLAQAIIDHLASGGSWRTRGLPDGRRIYAFQHPDLDLLWSFSGDPDEAEPEKEFAAKVIYVSHTLGMIGDVALAQELVVPLATVTDRFLDIQAASSGVDQKEEVALQLDLPVLLGATAQEIIRLREDKLPEFEKFRAALSHAIAERLQRGPDRDPEKLATEMIAEYIRPNLASIETELKSAQRALARKTAQSIAVGMVLTTVGLVTSMPLLIGTGVTAAAGSVLHANKYAENKREIELNDLYFLWHAAREHGGSHYAQ